MMRTVFLTVLLTMSAMVCHAAEGRSYQVNCLPTAVETHTNPILKVITLNVSHGRNQAINQLLVNKKETINNLNAIARLLGTSEADIVALQEADASSLWSGQFSHVDYLADKGQFNCYLHGFHSTGWLANYGTAILSKTRLYDGRSVIFPPSPPTKKKGYVTTRIKWQATPNTQLPVTLVSVHLDFLSNQVRDNQVAEMISNLSNVEGPIIILGDFNSDWLKPGSQVKKLADRLNLQTFKPLDSTIGTYKKTAGKRLDWILISKDLVFISYHVISDLVSDHLAVFAKISYFKEGE